MALRIYIRNHSPKCMHRLYERMERGEILSIDKEDLMDYRHCKCGWWIYGVTDSGVSIRPRALKAYTYGEADRKRRELNQPASADALAGIALSDLVELFLKHRREKNRTKGTEGIYQRIGQRVVKFCGALQPPVTLAGEVTKDHLVAMRTHWRESGLIKKLSTLNYNMGIVKMIFRYGLNEGRLAKNVAQSIEPIERSRERGADAPDDEGDDEGRTLPLDPNGGDANYRKLLDNVEAFMSGKLVVVGRKSARAKTIPVLGDAERFILLMELMYETGLRVSDAVHFKPAKMFVEDEQWVSYTTTQIKTGFPVTVFIPMALAERLAHLTPLTGDYVFFDKKATPNWRRFISDTVYRTVNDLGNAVGVPGARPHRFRDSFAVNRLDELVGMDHLSTLLGHRSVDTTKKYYSPWVKSQHDTLKMVVVMGRQTGQQLAQQRALAPVKPMGLIAIKRRRS